MDVAAVRSWSPPNLRPVLHLIGGMLAALGVLMLLPAAADALAGGPDWRAFAASSGFTVVCGAGCCGRRAAAWWAG
jgi:trk system potassium uptake protein TrkH